MDKQEYVKKKLNERPKDWSAIARGALTTRQTIARFMAGGNATMATINKLHNFLKGRSK
jgi:hypothetical protein